MKFILIYDKSSATADRRTTTYEDLEDDIWVTRGNYGKEEIAGALLDLMDLEDLDEYENVYDKERVTLDELAKDCVNSLDDFGDGSPNILYLQIGNRVYEDGKYNLDFNPETVTKKELINMLSDEEINEDLGY